MYFIYYLFHGWTFEHPINAQAIIMGHSTVLLGFKHAEKLLQQFGNVCGITKSLSEQ